MKRAQNKSQLYRLLSFDEYKKLNGTNIGSLRMMRISPRHYKHHLESPTSDTPFLAKGRAVHTLVFQPDLFPLQYVVFDGNRRKKEWKEFQAANTDKTILSVDEKNAALAMRDSVLNHRQSGLLKEIGDAELSIQWLDQDTGITCKARIDKLSRNVFELKTTRHKTPREFAKDCAYLGYHLGFAFYVDGCARVFRSEISPMVCISVQSSPPYDCVYYEVPAQTIEQGRYEYKELLYRLKECQERNSYPGVSDELIELPFPNWAYTTNSEDLELSIGGYLVKI